MLRVFQNLVCQSAFNDFPIQHHNGTVCQHTDNRQVMGNQQNGNAIFCFDLTNQIQYTRLYRQVQTCGNFVQQKQRRIVCQCFGNLHTLLHAAREIFRCFLHTGSEDFHCFQQFFRSGCHLPCASAAGSDDFFRNVGCGRIVHPQSSDRILIYHTHDVVADFSFFQWTCVPDILFAFAVILQICLTFCGNQVKIQTLHQSRFAGSAFPNDTQHLSRINLQRNIICRPNSAANSAAVFFQMIFAVRTAFTIAHGQVFYLQNGCFCHYPRTSLQ